MDLIRLHALADGELPNDEAKLIRVELAADPAASLELNAICNLKDCVREKALVYTCENTWTVSVKRIGEIDRARGVERFVARYAWGLSGAFLVLIVVGGLVNRSGHATRLESADIAGFVSRRSAPSNSGYDAWLDSQLRRARLSLARNELKVRGYETGVLNGRQVVRVSLSDNAGDLALLIIPGEVTFVGMDHPPASDSILMGKVNGVNCVAWTLGSQSMVLLGDRSYSQLQGIASRIAAQ